MSKAVEEVARPPKSARHAYESLPHAELAFMTVTETPNMRNAGVSIVNEKLRQGWVKPEDPELLQATPDGQKFRLILPKKELEARRLRNNKRARAAEGFRDHEAVKDTSREETKVKGAEVLEAMEQATLKGGAPSGGQNDDNG